MLRKRTRFFFLLTREIKFEGNEMKNICKLCGCKITVERSSHLRRSHGIDTSRGDAVRKHFASPHEYGISESEINSIREGAIVVVV